LNTAALTALLLFSGLSLQAGPAFAAGAVAVGVGPRGPASGYAIGYGFNQPDTDTAKSHAVRGCHGINSDVRRCGQRQYATGTEELPGSWHIHQSMRCVCD
jgi:hypothetical protein